MLSLSCIISRRDQIHNYVSSLAVEEIPGHLSNFLYVFCGVNRVGCLSDWTTGLTSLGLQTWMVVPIFKTENRQLQEDHIFSLPGKVNARVLQPWIQVEQCCFHHGCEMVDQLCTLAWIL